ncbi:glycosyltransferase family 4 protein [Paenibacillus sp. GCM10027628]|uniref:glycosyltransferase family 4 protein n=1 Tax=Paenibacillus sp. GCM10027628 TaxID=3273413 RepID=UPI003630E887
MRIAMISTNVLAVPPIDYGGTEREVHYLTEELTRRGHKVFLFAKKGSVSNATKTFYWPSGNKQEQLAFLRAKLPANIDIIHDHYGLASKLNTRTPIVRSNHGNSRLFVKHPVYVSKTMLMTIGKGKGYYIPNGIRLADYKYSTRKADYLLFLGRMNRLKGVHLAIEVAKKTDKKLLLAGPVTPLGDKKYFQSMIRPQLNKNIQYIGSVGGARKQKLLSQASCVLFPSIWNEPFGLVMVEALASGTPVLALKNGAAPEVLKGMPQLLCRNANEMANKVKNLSKLPPPYTCRRYVRTHYSDRVLATRFIALYKRILRRR